MGTLISQNIPYSATTLSQQSTPIGAIIPYMGTTAPSGYLACDGGVYSISLYPLLAGFFEAQFGSINYFGGDGTSTFAVPNLQGEFLRGAGTNAHTDQGDGANVGVHQDGTSFLDYSIAGNVTGASLGTLQVESDVVKNTYNAGIGNYDSLFSSRKSYARAYFDAGDNISTGYAKKTSRPTNTSVLYIIKAKSDRLDKITFAEVDDTSVSSDAVWSAEKIQGILDTICAPNAGAHNGIFRGKYLGNSVTAAQWAAIDAGTFDDLYIGDYWTINGVNWRIAGLDTYLHTGDTELTDHHAVIVPDTCLYEAKMNNSDITTGGYVSSVMYTTNLNTAKTTINSAFGNSHVLSFKNLFTKTVTSGAASDWGWYSCTVFLMNEIEVYGAHAWANPASYNTGIGNRQLPLFKLAPEFMVANYNNERKWWWLRDVVSASVFATCTGYGTAGITGASGSGGVRPAFLIS